MYKDLIHIDRNSFINWTQGVILHFEKGCGFVVNETECMEAETELNKGNAVVLMINNKPVSIVELINNEFIEKEI